MRACSTCDSRTGLASLNPRGLGQAPIYPCYTVNKNQDTLITMVNASDLSKLVEVSFAEAAMAVWTRIPIGF